MGGEDLTGRENPKALTTDQLISETELRLDSEGYWDYVVALQFRPEETVFRAARVWCASNDPGLRALGADVLGQLGVWDRPFHAESLLVLWPLLEDASVDVLSSTLHALGHLNIAGEESRIAPLLGHGSPDVRHAIVCALLTVESDLAARMLIRLSDDPDTNVRDWATFGLGSQNDMDSAEIRDALYRRTTDSDDETRGEALVGLALRRDKRVVAPLLEELCSDSVGTLAVEAAKEIADPSLLDTLQRLVEWWDVDADLLQEAISACECSLQSGERDGPI